ncbi:alginate lyase family protein [Pararhodobacter oceanensis]|uniref:Heparinase n=1 Tax=Pararhodobacter oceanensis TaxID=2172121 RepID=A0A2T8HS25_9RHOB|nr:alginate lyase family protein [Pararhodobacter oceanensis]PVH28249.1 heparinase [Pararhodobacter oceanensis]
MKRLTKLRTYGALGPASIARVAIYRLGIKSGLHPVQRLAAPVAKAPFFHTVERRKETTPANTAWDEEMWWFGWYRQPRPTGPPDWFANPFAKDPQLDASLDWWKIPDFGAGDIKGLWELSRFDWVVAWATKAALGDSEALERLNLWLADWARTNPPYKGPNWKCGQEASIRVMHLITAAWLLEQDEGPEAGLVEFVRAHILRIAPTMSYAIGQQNNHGTSEAAALFIGGHFLMGHDPRAASWADNGRRWLEERATTLIEPDGSFSQYSVTYHRLMLDTYALVEAWRRHRGLRGFSDRLVARLGKATNWLRSMVEDENGDAPNIGANDGARLVQLTDTDYRDFRPSVQLASALFRKVDAFGPGPWMRPLRWLNVPDGRPAEAVASTSFDQGGYHILRTGRAIAVLRYPKFRFRPSQADALHLDLWCRGKNLLRDGGTFSYNAEGAEWFGGSEAHNTVIFDGRDQMPRLGRFLFGDWLRAEAVEHVRIDGETVTAAAAYTDRNGARHHRRVILTPVGVTCIDTISGAFRRADLHWRLHPGDWRLEGNILRGMGLVVSLQSDGEEFTPTLGATSESRYYQLRNEVPLLSVTVYKPTQILTRIDY